MNTQNVSTQTRNYQLWEGAGHQGQVPGKAHAQKQSGIWDTQQEEWGESERHNEMSPDLTQPRYWLLSREADTDREAKRPQTSQTQICPTRGRFESQKFSARGYWLEYPLLLYAA